MVCWRISQGLVKVNKITSEIRSIEFVLKFSVHLVRIGLAYKVSTSLSDKKHLAHTQLWIFHSGKGNDALKTDI